jgi:hypothetical protein
MRKKIAIALTAGVAAATMGFGAAGTASAAPNNEGAACVQKGIGFLKANNLLQAAAQNPAKKTIDYSDLADPVKGPIFTTLPDGSYFSLGQVVKLHTTNPGLFLWCGGGPAA